MPTRTAKPTSCPDLRRNSKLTMLLQDSLGGDAKALMFCNVAPAALHAGDTFSSLNFASKVRRTSHLTRCPAGALRHKAC
jgi:hypothetical protein